MKINSPNGKSTPANLKVLRFSSQSLDVNSTNEGVKTSEKGNRTLNTHS
jgi:hypothetical protein